MFGRAPEPVSWECRKPSLPVVVHARSDGLISRSPVATPARPAAGLYAMLKAIDYPVIARKAAIDGAVVIDFSVSAQGEVTRVEVVKGLGAGIEEEVERVVRATAFEPAEQDGQPVAARLRWPVSFALYHVRPLRFAQPVVP